jgi:hypothetical protein
MLALHLLQSALVLVNARLVERVLAEPEWADRLTVHDRHGLTALFWSNVALHGTFNLHLNARLGSLSLPCWLTCIVRSPQGVGRWVLGRARSCGLPRSRRGLRAGGPVQGRVAIA